PTMSAIAPNDIYTSSMPTRPRMKAWRKPIAPPSDRTTRPPAASLPRLRLRVSVSTVMGRTARQTTSSTIAAIWAVPSSSTPACASAPRPQIAPARYSAQPMTASMSPPRARRPRPSGCRSSATASPVRTSSSATSARGPAGPVNARSDMRTVNQVNLDALIDERRPEWDRLDQLARRRRLTGAETDEFVHLYRAASADLADIKTSVGRTQAGDYVSNILARARMKRTGTPENVLRQVPRFFARQRPAALYRSRWDTLVVAVSFIAIVGLVGWWAQQDPAYMAALGDDASLEQYAEEDFVAYYSEHAEGVSAGMVWTNNAWIAAQAIMFGITGIWPVYVIVQNAVGLGVSAAVMNWYGHGDDFLLFILPHGLLEMTCIFVAGAAGMRIFWAWIAPGARTRGEALASEG